MADHLPALAEPSAIDQAADPAHYVQLACERAKAWLTDALDHGDIDQIVEIKSQAEAIRIYTTQKKLGKDAELAAAEVVRRAERGIGLAIRRGQEAGTINALGAAQVRPSYGEDHGPDGPMISPMSYLGTAKERTGAYAMTDGVPDEQFEEAIAEAKEEGNLSRANVVRKVKGTPPPARERSEWHYKARHIDHYRVLNETISALEGLMGGIRLLDLDAIPQEERGEWGEQLRDALRPLNKFAREVSR